MRDEVNISIQANAELILLRPLGHFIRELFSQLPEEAVSSAELENVELAFNEAFANIHKHAYPGDEKGPVRIDIKIQPHSLEFRFEDWGVGFDPDRLEEPDLERPKEGGLGVWLIRQVMDEFIYSSDEVGKNTLRLVKRIGEPERKKDPS